MTEHTLILQIKEKEGQLYGKTNNRLLNLFNWQYKASMSQFIALERTNKIRFYNWEYQTHGVQKNYWIIQRFWETAHLPLP